MTAYFTVVGSWQGMWPGSVVNGKVSFTPSVELVTLPGNPGVELIGTPRNAVISGGSLSLSGGGQVQLLANTTDLGIAGVLTYAVRFLDVTVDGVSVSLPGFTITAPTVGNVTYDIVASQFIYTTTALSIIGLTAGVTGFAVAGDRKRRVRRSLVCGLANTKG